MNSGTNAARPDDPLPPARPIAVGDVALHVVEHGPDDGPPVILLHGFPEFSFGWRRQIGPLAAAGFRVAAPDGRGYNRSSKPVGVRAYHLDALVADVVGLADALGRERVSLVGHDWGGIVAWWAAARHPDRVERLAVLNAPHPAIARPYLLSHPNQMLRSWYVGFFQIPGLPEALLRADGYAALRRSLRRTSRPGTFGEADLDAYARAWCEPGALTGMVNWYRALRHFRPEGPMRVAAPTLLLWGVRDPFLEIGLAEESLALCERGRLVRLEDATHWLHLEEPDRVNRELIGFLR
jgi:pimeloyl-ACP methyl ester carboxylesterase